MKPLALLRIAVAIVALISPEPAMARVVAQRSPALWTIPEGLGWMSALVAEAPIMVATAILRAAAIAAILGVFRRAALAVLALTLLYVFGAAQLTGTVTHDMHLFWFAALLACVKRGEDDPRALSVARLWLGLVYFFPGVHKLAGGGLAWVTSDNLRNQMYFKWYEAGGVAPWPRIDLVPHLVNVIAACVIAFVAMPVLVSFRRTRIVALVLGLLFHLAAGRFLDVLFPSLMACYVVLLPERARVGAPLNRTRTLVAATFTAAIVVQGLRGQTQAFPFACYPTFATLAGDEIVDLAVDDGGRTLRLPRVRRPDEWGMVWRLAGLYGDRVEPERLRAFARSLGAGEGAIVYGEAYDVRPSAWGAPPKRRWSLSPE